MNIGSAIKAIRKEANITQEQLSKRTGISQTSLSKIESGATPTASNLKKICLELGVAPSIIYILATEEEDIPPTSKTKYNLLFPAIKNLIFELVKNTD